MSGTARTIRTAGAGARVRRRAGTAADTTRIAASRAPRRTARMGPALRPASMAGLLACGSGPDRLPGSVRTARPPSRRPGGRQWLRADRSPPTVAGAATEWGRARTVFPFHPSSEGTIGAVLGLRQVGGQVVLFCGRMLRGDVAIPGGNARSNRVRFIDYRISRASRGMEMARTGMHKDRRAAAPSIAHKPTAQERLAIQNVRDLSRVISTEAGGEGEAAMTAVGWTLRNRMQRDDTTHVSGAWGGYQHDHAASPPAVRIARGILANTIADPTSGATHFYTPRIMPKSGDETTGIDVGGGLETVDGVDRNGKPIQNYRPGWTLTFDRKLLLSVPEASFKFYRQPGSGRVR